MLGENIQMMKSSVEIMCPVEKLFAYIEDGNKTDTYMNNEFRVRPVLKPPSEDGYYRLGGLILGQGSFFAGIVVKIAYRVTVVKANELVSLKAEGGKFDSEVKWTLESLDENKSRIALEVTLKPRSSLMAMATNLMQSHVEPTVTNYLHRSLVQLKNILEQETLEEVA